MIWSDEKILSLKTGFELTKCFLVFDVFYTLCVCVITTEMSIQQDLEQECKEIMLNKRFFSLPVVFLLKRESNVLYFFLKI